MLAAMLTLYYAPGACSISPLIALCEANLPFQLERVDMLRGKKLEDGTSFVDVNPKGYVPALRLDDGEVLTEGVAIVQYIADLAPAAALAPPAGTRERVRLWEWLNYISTELHKGVIAFIPKYGANDEFKQGATERFEARLAYLERSLGDEPFLLGDFSVADGYAFYALRLWHVTFKHPLSPALTAYYARILARPGVRKALELEGFTKL